MSLQKVIFAMLAYSIDNSAAHIDFGSSDDVMVASRSDFN